MLHKFRQNNLRRANQKQNKTRSVPSAQLRRQRIWRVLRNSMKSLTYPSMCSLVQSPPLMCVCKLSRFTKYIGCARDQINKTGDSSSHPRRPLPSNSKPLKKWFTERRPEPSEQWHCLVSTLLSDSTMKTLHLKWQTFQSALSPSLTLTHTSNTLPFPQPRQTAFKSCASALSHLLIFYFRNMGICAIFLCVCIYKYMCINSTERWYDRHI